MRNSHSNQGPLDPDIRQVADTSTAPPTAYAMSANIDDRLRRIAEQVADCFLDTGYAFVEEDKIEGLAAMLGSFLTVAGIPINHS